MHWVFATVRFFPYWALPLVLVFFETGVYFKRRNKKRRWAACWAVMVLLFAGIGTWFAFRGDVHSDQWVKTALNQGQ